MLANTGTTACTLCHGTRHIETEQGFKRCPDCFVQASLERELVRHGYPKVWAQASVDALSSILGTDHPLVTVLNRLFTGQSLAAHFYGGPSESREMIFAATLRGFLTKWSQVNMLDTAELAPKHFEKDRQTIRLKPAPAIITVGKEIERKVGAFYLRSTLEFAVPRRFPVVLFSDTNFAGLQSYYGSLHGDFAGLYEYAHFEAVAIP